MTIDTIKSEIKDKFPFISIVDRKATKHYPRTLWLKHGYNKLLISDDYTMTEGYSQLKQVYDNYLFESTDDTIKRLKNELY